MLANSHCRMMLARLIESVRFCASQMTNKLKVELQLAPDATDEAPGAQCVARWVNTACEFSGSGELLNDCCVTVRMVDEAESQHLNFAFRQQACPTNVLAFPGAANQEFLPKEAGEEFGDIVICLPLVQREAAEQHKARDAHLAHLVVHGTLHLLGFCHDDAESARSMEELEVKILGELGIPDPYAAGVVVSEQRC